MSVAVRPGASVFTVIPRLPSSAARATVNVSIAALVMLYAEYCGIGRRERPEETLMTRPPSRSRGMACWVVKNGPLTLVANTRSKSASVAVAVGPTTATPALFTRMSKRRSPRRAVNSASSASKNRPSCSTEPTSAWRANASPPADSISPTTDRAASALLW